MEERAVLVRRGFPTRILVAPACRRRNRGRRRHPAPQRRSRLGHRKQFRPWDTRSGVPARALPAQNGHLMSQGDELELQRAETTNPEREQRTEGGQKREHAGDGMAVAAKTPCFLGSWSLAQAQALPSPRGRLMARRPSRTLDLARSARSRRQEGQPADVRHLLETVHGVDQLRSGPGCQRLGAERQAAVELRQMLLPRERSRRMGEHRF